MATEMATNGVERETLTVDEAARVLGIGRSSAWAAVNHGELPAVRIGKRLVVPRVALDRLLAGGVHSVVHTYKGEGLTACGLEVVGPCPDCATANGERT